MELWKYIEGQEERYAVSSEGRVMSFYKTKKKKREVPLIMKGVEDSHGYLKVRLGENKSFSIHRLVALAFNANPENKRTVDHIDGNRTNNCSTNLRWANRSEQGNKVCNSNTGWPGVNWVERRQSYQAQISLPIKDGEKRGKQISKSYSVKKYGAEAAIKLAIKWRDDREKEIDPAFYGNSDR